MNSKPEAREQLCEEKEGIIFEIERYAVNDGPGIRTMVFLKGCPLRCMWCANPESHKRELQLMYWKTRCIGCMRCIKECPCHALSFSDGRIRIDRKLCKLCGRCTEVCNSMALTAVGRRMTVSQVMEQVRRDEAFYSVSGGGVTFSGGEAFAQSGFLIALLKASKQHGYHVCIETSGYAGWEAVKEAAKYADIFLYDFKCMDSVRHSDLTGVSNEGILDNYKRLAALGADIIARIPVIPGCNSGRENFSLIADFLEENNPGCRVDLLPYHALGASKYERLGISYGLPEIKPPSPEFMEEAKRYFSGRGFEVTVGG